MWSLLIAGQEDLLIEVEAQWAISRWAYLAVSAALQAIKFQIPYQGTYLRFINEEFYVIN